MIEIVIFILLTEICFPKEILVVMSTDDNYFRPTIVAMTSMFENAHSDTFYEVNVLSPSDFKNENKVKIGILEKKYKCKIEVVDMGEKYENLKKKKFPAPAYYRLQIASILLHQKKCIYLDGDVVVRHDLSEMYDIDISNYYVAGVWNGLGLPENHSEHLGMPDLKQYICSGVLLMNLEKMRENMLEKQFFKYIKDVGMKKLTYADQDIINPVCYGKILLMPLKFCLLENEVDMSKSYEESDYARMFSTPGDWKAKDPKIVHFAGLKKPWKPWKYALETSFVKEWWYYADKTGLYDKEIMKRKRRHEKKCGERKRGSLSHTTSRFPVVVGENYVKR